MLVTYLSYGLLITAHVVDWSSADTYCAHDSCYHSGDSPVVQMVTIAKTPTGLLRVTVCFSIVGVFDARLALVQVLSFMKPEEPRVVAAPSVTIVANQ